MCAFAARLHAAVRVLDHVHCLYVFVCVLVWVYVLLEICFRLRACVCVASCEFCVDAFRAGPLTRLRPVAGTHWGYRIWFCYSLMMCFVVV